MPKLPTITEQQQSDERWRKFMKDRDALDDERVRIFLEYKFGETTKDVWWKRTQEISAEISKMYDDLVSVDNGQESG